MAEKLDQKNIYQRMIEVQKKVLSVQKNETVKMSENDKGYKAVTHDDVAAALHLALAEAGIVMVPNVKSYTVSNFDKTNQWGKVVTWYRTDIEIIVKWINADKPDDFIESLGAAFALDTSDKSFAKAYSLALKIVLLKVHLLESRDGEEQRPFDDANGGTTAGKGQPANKNQKTERPKQSPDQVIMPFGQAKGKKIGDLDTPTLEKAAEWLRSELKKDPKPQNHGQLGFIYSQVKAVLTTRKPEPPPTPPEKPPMPESQEGPFPPDDIQEHPPVEMQSQEPQRRGQKQKDEPAKYLINVGHDFDGVEIGQLMERDIISLYQWTDEQMKTKGPPPKGIGEILALNNNLKSFLKSANMWPINHAPK